MSILRKFQVLCLFLTVSLLAIPVSADTLNVLWYTYTPNSAYTQHISDFAAQHGFNVTFFSGGQQDFSAYDVLVTQSWPFPNFQNQADWPGSSAYAPNYSGLLADSAAIAAARDPHHTVISGMDVDFHLIYGGPYDNLPNDPNAVLNGTDKLLTNMINWAGSGDKLGVVALNDFSGEDSGKVPGGQWWFDPNSFLAQDLAGVHIDNGDNCFDNTPTPAFPCITYKSVELSYVVPVNTDHPVNNGIDWVDLSGWGESYHAYFRGAPNGYIPVNAEFDDALYGFPVLVSTPVPEPMTLALAAAGIGAGWWRRRKLATK